MQVYQLVCPLQNNEINLNEILCTPIRICYSPHSSLIAYVYKLNYFLRLLSDLMYNVLYALHIISLMLCTSIVFVFVVDGGCIFLYILVNNVCVSLLIFNKIILVNYIIKK